MNKTMLAALGVTTALMIGCSGPEGSPAPVSASPNPTIEPTDDHATSRLGPKNTLMPALTPTFFPTEASGASPIPEATSSVIAGILQGITFKSESLADGRLYDLDPGENSYNFSLGSSEGNIANLEISFGPDILNGVLGIPVGALVDAGYNISAIYYENMDVFASIVAEKDGQVVVEQQIDFDENTGQGVIVAGTRRIVIDQSLIDYVRAKLPSNATDAEVFLKFQRIDGANMDNQGGMEDLDGDAPIRVTISPAVNP